jgi:hypothetical protein
MIRLVYIAIILSLSTPLLAQPVPFAEPLSSRIANYVIDLTLDTINHQINASQVLTFHNPSGDTIYTMPFHMYYNAFKNNQTSFLTETARIPRTKPEEDIVNCEWPWIEVLEVKDEYGNLLSSKYIQPDNDNTNDHSVLEVRLDKPIMPYETCKLVMQWHSHIPKALVRTGYSRDYYFMAQWYPKLGVYEPAGTRFAVKGQWNCHQYHANTEYYGEFGVYQVNIKVPEQYKVGASGFLVDKKIEDGWAAHSYLAEDVIDFTWTACPRFLEIKEDWKGVELKLLIMPEHEVNKDRFLGAAKHTLDFFESYIEKYPYPSLTIVSPPCYGLFSGAMEYPTLITAPTLKDFPTGIKTTETLTIHEITHQYFMQMLATNEQEEPWMDEGFTSFFEARIMDTYYPDGIINFWGIKVGSEEFRRGRFFNADNIKVNPLSDFGWHFRHGSYSEIVYGKAAVLLSTLEMQVGKEVMQQIIQTYFKRWKFKHPGRQDFIDVALEVTAKQLGDDQKRVVASTLQQGIFSTDACDYSVHSISTRLLPPAQGFFDDLDNCERALKRDKPIYESKIILYRLEGFKLPITTTITFDDGTTSIEQWDGQERSHEIVYRGMKKVVQATIQEIPLDKNSINNSYTLAPESTSLWSFLTKSASWLEGVMANIAVLI